MKKLKQSGVVLTAFLLIVSLICSAAIAQNSQDARQLTHPKVSQLPAKAKRWALIIGVNDYQKDISPLYGSVNDARMLREVLINYADFPAHQIILMVSGSSDPDLTPTRGNILDALERLSRQVPEGGFLLFSFSGHGVAIGNDAFLVPADGRVYKNVELMRDRSIDVLRVKQAIRQTPVKQVVMLLDACRNDPSASRGEGANPLTAAYREGFSFDVRNDEIDAFATIFATSLGDRAYEFLDKETKQYRGFFSHAIEEALKGAAANEKGEITLGKLINYLEQTVSQRVSIEKNQKQVPYPITEGYRNSELVLALVPLKAEATNPLPTAPAANLAAWNLQPLVAGEWEGLNETEFASTYDRLLKSVPAESTDVVKRIKRFRRMKLSFYPGAFLYEGLVPTSRFDDGGVFTFIRRNKDEITLLNGTSPPIHELNAKVPLALTNDAVAEDYLRFFHSAVYGEEGDFHIVDNGSDILWERDVAMSNRLIVEKHIKPLLIEKVDDSNWRSQVTVQYGNGVFYANMALQRTGMIEMLEDQPFSADIPARTMHFHGSLRHEVADWGSNSLNIGKWESPSLAVSQQIFAELLKSPGARAHQELIKQITRFRRVGLPFYPGAYLYEGLIPATSYEARRIFSFVVLKDNAIFLLDGSQNPIHELDRRAPLALKTDAQAGAYFRFFIFAGVGNASSVRVIDEESLLSWIDAERKSKVEKLIKPMEVVKKNANSWTINATLQRGNALRQGRYVLDSAGTLLPVEEKVLEANLSVRHEKFTGPVRAEVDRNSNVKIELTIVDAQFHNMIGHSYAEEDRLELALSYLTKAVQINPRFAEAYDNRADVYMKQGEDQKALKDLNQAVELQDDLDTAYYKRGQVYERLKMFDKALIDYKKVLQLVPDNEDAKKSIESLRNRGIR